MPTASPDRVEIARSQIKSTQKDAKVRVLTGRTEVTGNSSEEVKKAAAEARRTQEEIWSGKAAAEGGHSVLEAWKTGQKAKDIEEIRSSAEKIIQKHAGNTTEQAKALDMQELSTLLAEGNTEELLKPENIADVKRLLVDPVRQLMQQVPEFKPIADEIDGAMSVRTVSSISPDAESLLARVDAGGIPFAMTTNLARIATENGIDPAIGVNEVISALKDKAANPNTEVDSDAPTKEWITYLTQQIDAGRGEGRNRFDENLTGKIKAFLEKPREEGTDLETATKGLVRAQRNVESLNSEFTGNETRLREIEESIKEFNDPSRGRGKELTELKEKIIRDKPEKDAAQEKFDRAKLALEQAQALRKSAGKNGFRYDSEVSSAQRALNEAETALNEFTKDIRKRDSLTGEQEHLGREKKRLDDEQYRLDAEIAGARKTATAAESLKTKIEKGEVEGKSFNEEFSEVVADAFKETMRAREEQEMANIETTFQGLLDKATDEPTKKILKGNMDRLSEWKQHRQKKWLGFKKGEEAKEPINYFLKKDIAVLLGSLKNGDEEYIRRRMSSEGITNYDEQTKLLANEKFQEEAVKPTIATALREAVSRGLLTKREQEEIAETEWGRDAIEEAIKLDHEAHEKLEEHAKKQGYGSVKEMLKNKKLAWWALFTFAFPGAGVAVLGGYAGYRLFKEIKGGGHASGGSH